MISKKLLGYAALAAAATLVPSALAAVPGSLASCTITIRQYTGDTLAGGLVATTSVDLTGVTSTTYADGVGRVRQSVDGFGKVSTATYDANGNLLNRTDATGAGTNYVYDNLNRRLTETDLAIAGKVRSYAYDLVGRLITATDPLGIVTTYAYDLRDRKVSDSTPMNGTVTRVIAYAYDGRGDMTTLTDANGAVTTWGFDSAGRQISKLYANGDTRAMAYDAAGRVVTLTDENGDVITSTYDLAGRLTAKAYAADSGTDTYAYDAASRMTSVTKGRYNHTLTYGYDSAGRLATETHPDGEVVNYAYDAANRLANLGITAGATAVTSTAASYAVAYAYDARGMMSSVSTGDYSSTYAYRDNGQVSSMVDFQIINPQSDILRADLSYDAGARLTQVANTAINGDQSGDVYTLGADDQRLTATEETGQKWQYGYDGLKQLVSANKTDTSASIVPPLSQSYGYDPMGNRRTYTEQGTSVAYTTNAANQYTSVVATGALPVTQSPTYDHNGNMLTDGVRNYTWDADNQLTSVTPVAPVTGSQQVQYAYDWRGRRTTKTSSVYTGTAWGVANTSAYKYAEWNPIEENVTNASTGAVTTKNYVWGNDLSGNMNGAGGVGGLLSQRLFASGATSPAVYFYAYDGNGNVLALVQANAANPAASGIVERYAYDGFGRELAGGTPAVSSVNSFRFSTKQADAETGMNYYGYRFYDANNGRWINRDFIQEEGGANLYNFCLGDAIGSYDILGNQALVGPDVSVVSYIANFYPDNYLDAAMNQYIRHGGVVKNGSEHLIALALDELNISANPLPDSSINVGSYMNSTKEYRGFINFKARVDASGEASIVTNDHSYGYTPLRGSVGGATQTYLSGEGDYTELGPAKTGSDYKFVTINRFRVGAFGQKIAKVLTGFDAPYVSQKIEYTINPCTKKYHIKVFGSKFPSHRAYINGNSSGLQSQSSPADAMFIGAINVPMGNSPIFDKTGDLTNE